MLTCIIESITLTYIILMKTALCKACTSCKNNLYQNESFTWHLSLHCHIISEGFDSDSTKSVLKPLSLSSTVSKYQQWKQTLTLAPAKSCSNDAHFPLICVCLFKCCSVRFPSTVYTIIEAVAPSSPYESDYTVFAKVLENIF